MSSCLSEFVSTALHLVSLLFATVTLSADPWVTGLFLTEMASPGSTDLFGNSNFRNFFSVAFQVPCSQPPPGDGSVPLTAGSRTDMGTLVLFLVANWFVNGETVLIDGGVSSQL